MSEEPLCVGLIRLSFHVLDESMFDRCETREKH